MQVNNVIIFGGVSLAIFLVWLLTSLVIGAIIGLLASLITKSERGFLSNALVGIVGSWLGGLLGWVLGFSDANWVGNLALSVFGAILITLIFRGFGGRQTQSA